MKKVVLFAFCVALDHAAFALHDSAAFQSESPFWAADWSWKGRPSKGLTGLNDEDFVDMLYRRPDRAKAVADHPTLEQRMEYRKTYEVTEEPEKDWEIDGGYSNLDDQQDLPHPDNSIGSGAQPHSSSSSTFMSSTSGDSLYTAYSHKIIHNKK